MSRWLQLLVLVSTITSLTAIDAAFAQEPPPAVVIFGGDLPHPVQLAATDADALTRRINLPPELEEEPPDLFGDAYMIRSDYWDAAVRSPRSTRPPAEPLATYYPDGGYVQARQAGEDVWLVLDLRQRAILDRYIDLTKASLLPERPGVLQELTLAWRSEDMGITIGGRNLTQEEQGTLVRALELTPAMQFLDPPQPPAGTRGAWLVFSLEEGRTIQLLYDRDSAILVDFFGTELYPVAPPVAAVMEDLLPRDGAFLPIQQQPGRGSPIWWLIMAGGGAACLGIAIWLRRVSAAAA